MAYSVPNLIKEYYIAYFDILGYKEFFRQHPDKVPELLNSIHDAIQRTKEHISILRQSPLLGEFAQIDIRERLFSDNILLCMETSDDRLEPVRSLAFIKAVSDIQRGFVLDYGLFVRGGIVKGQLSFNDDYVFGQGVIDAVSMEGTAQYPRILISKDIVNELNNTRFCSHKAYEHALKIVEKMKNGENVSEEDAKQCAVANNNCFLDQLFQYLNKDIMVSWDDNCWVVNYLYIIDLSSIIAPDVIEQFSKAVLTASPKDAEMFMPKANIQDQQKQTQELFLQAHKRIVQNKLKEFGNYVDIALENIKEAETREKILKKYIWAMAYHNRVCRSVQKMDYFISTICNCDTRFLIKTIEVVEDEPKALAD